MSTPKHIVITGASSGLGAALATLYAAPGIRLSLMGRQEERLAAVATAAQNKGAQVATAYVDVTDRAEMEKTLLAWDYELAVDLVIANAGTSAGTGDGQETLEQINQIFAVNVGGVFNTITPLQSRMISRRAGHIAIMSSLASFHGFAGAPAYCASKAAVRVYGEGLQAALAPHAVAVSVICPGFIATPMTERNPFPMPLLMTAEKAAQIIQAGLQRRARRVAFPYRLYAVVRMLDILPGWLVTRLTADKKKT
jgi:short-subunit dehydrogenase